MVCWKLKDRPDGREKADVVREAKRRLESLKDKIPDIEKIAVSTTVVGSTSDIDLVLYTEFASEKALENYQHHPAHEEVREFIGRIRETRFVIDYEV